MTNLATTSSDNRTDLLGREHEGHEGHDGEEPVLASPSDRASDLAPAQRPRTMEALVETLGLAGMGYPDAKRRVLAEFNDAYVGAMLASTSGNMSEAARRSGLDRSNFRRLVRTTSVEPASSGTPDASSIHDDEA